MKNKSDVISVVVDDREQNSGVADALQQNENVVEYTIVIPFPKAEPSETEDIPDSASEDEF